MHQAFCRKLLIISLFIFSIFFGQVDLNINHVMGLEWQPEMAKKESYYLNLSVWGLVQTGQAPKFSQILAEHVNISKLSESNKLQVYLLLSLPSSLTGDSQLSSALAKKLLILEEFEFHKNKLNILEKNWLPAINSDAELIKNQDFLKYALQLFALSVFESRTIRDDENQKLLIIVDKYIFHFGEWLGSENTEQLIQGWKPYVKSLNRLINEHAKDGMISGDFAKFAAEWAFIESFFIHRGQLW